MKLAATIAIWVAMATTHGHHFPQAHYPAGWKADAVCIHLHESVDWHWGPDHHPRQSTWNQYYGGFQFTLGTWQSTFAPGEPHGHTYFHPEDASVDEQFRRAFVNWTNNGHRFGGRQWPHSAAECHVQ